MSREFTKYRQRGAYHWREASARPFQGWPYTRSRVDWVVRQCRSSAMVLEVGCGDAVILGRLARAGKRVTGVDADDTALALARQMFARHGFSGEFYADLSAVKETRFDTVILAEVIEHLDDAESLIKHLAEFLPPEGRLILTTPIRLLEQSLDTHHVHEFWPGELRALLSRYFEQVELDRMHPVWLVDLMCFGVKGVRPVAVLANLLKACTGIELIDMLGSPLTLYWTQTAVATNPRSRAR